MNSNTTHDTASAWYGFLSLLAVGVVVAMLMLLPIRAAHAATGAPESGGFMSRMSVQIEKVLTVAFDVSRKIFSGEALQVAQVGRSSNELLTLEEVATLPAAYVPTATSERGTLLINAPLRIDATLSVSGVSTLGTTTILGLLSSPIFETAVLTVRDTATMATLRALGAASIDGLLTARGGIQTSGANVDLMGGRIFASNVVNELVAGDNITITGTTQRPIVSVDLDQLEVVTSINGEDGDVEFEGGDDIEVDGTTISNESTLESVRDRGGCSDCILDADVSDVLTVIGGTIDGTVIGVTTQAAAYFTNVAVGSTSTAATLQVFGTLTTIGTATTTFGGGVNITSGCFAVDGVCIAGAEPASYVGLTDTPNTLLAGAIQFANASGTALTQSSEFAFINGNFGLGTSTPEDRLSVVGGSSFVGAFTVTNSTSSVFVGGINVTDGCVAVDGTCLSSVAVLDDLLDVAAATVASGDILQYDGVDWVNVATSSLGFGDGTYVGLTDTPNTLLAGAIQFANASGTALTQSSEFVFLNDRLGIGTSSPVSIFSVVGTSTFVGNINVTDGCVAVDGTCLGGVTELSNLNDVTLTAPSGGDYLQYDGAVWRNVSIASLGDGTYLGLTDTPNSYVASALVFANATSSGLTQSSSLRFSGGNLLLGTSSVATALSVNGDASLVNHGALRFYEVGTSNYVGFRASTSLAANTVWTLPTEDGTVDQILVTDGSGNLRFEDVSAVGGGVTNYLDLSDTPNSFVAGAIQYVHASSTYLTQSSSFVFTGTNLGIGVTVPTTRLAVDGSVNFKGAGGTAGVYFDQALGTVGIGTNSPTDRLAILGGSFTQRGGNSTTEYSPTLVGGLVLSDTVLDIDIAGNFAFLVSASSGNDLHVIDITNPAVPVQVASINLSGTAQAIVVRGKYAYIGTNTVGANFHVIDISNPFAPVEVTTLIMPAAVNDIALSGSYAYVATDATGDDVSVVDISDPLSPVIVGGVNLPADTNGVAVAGHYAYAAVEGVGDEFYVIDVSNPTAPTSVASVPLSDVAMKITVEGGYAYVTTNLIGDDLHVIDISTPTSPSEVSSVGLDAAGRGVAAVGHYVYVASLSTGDDLEVVDVSNPLSAVRVGGVNLGAGDAYGIKIVGRYAYMTTSSGGQDFHVYDISGATIQSAQIYSIAGSNLTITGDAHLNGQLNVGEGIFAGKSGFITDGSIISYGTSDSFFAGSLGIGTTSTSSALAVDGSVLSTSLLGGAVSLSTDANGVIIRDPSDERLKENITPIEHALATVLDLRGVRYEWKDKERFGNQAEIGFIAQEVDLVLPEVVRKGGDYWSLNTRNIVAVVVEAVKEMWQVVDRQGQEIDALEARVQELESALEVTAEQPSDEVADDDNDDVVIDVAASSTDQTVNDGEVRSPEEAPTVEPNDPVEETRSEVSAPENQVTDGDLID